MPRDFTKTVAIKAVDEDERTATGAVLVPNEVDRQRDFLRPAGVESLFAADPDDGVMHSAFPDNAADLVRSEIVDEPIELNGEMYPAGTWVATREYRDDDLWQLVKDGILSGFSIGGQVSDVREYEADDVPDDVSFPAEVEPGPATEIVDGSVEEVSDVDIPAVPRATYRELSKLGKAITDEVEDREEFVEIMRGRGHDRDDARRLWRYLETNKAADVSKPIVLPNGAEFDNFDECVASVSGGDTSVDDAEAICGAGREQNKNDETNETRTMTTKAEYGTDDWVSWEASGGRARGQIVDMTEDGQFDAEISGDVTVEGTENEPAYLIEVWQGRGEDASPIDEEAGRGDTMHVAHQESTLRSISDPRETEASKSGIIASLKSLFGGGGGADDDSMSEDSDDAVKAGRTLSQRNRRAVMASVDAQLDILDDAGIDHGMTRFTDRADFAFDLDEYSGGKGQHSDDMDKDAPESDISDDTMTDENTEKSDAPDWAKSLTETVEQIDKRVTEMEDGDGDAEKSLDDAPEWAKTLAEKVDGLDERVDKVSKATADTQQVGGTEKTGGDDDSDLSTTEKQKRELFGLSGGN